MAATKGTTAEDLEAMGSDAAFELIRGVLRDDPPGGMRVGVVSGRLCLQIGRYVEQHGLGYATNLGGYILERDPDTVLGPNVGFVRKERLPQGIAFEGFCPFPPDFAVEVMSPSDRPRDVEEKVALYLAAGVPRVWWVRPGDRAVAVYRPGQPPEVFGPDAELDGEPVLPGFRLAVAAIFA
jgi:Uma2 family endonuclease